MVRPLTIWPESRIEELKSLAPFGLSCREIAARLGVSRDAVIGKINRLGLAPEFNAARVEAKAKTPEPRTRQKARRVEQKIEGRKPVIIKRKADIAHVHVMTKPELRRLLTQAVINTAAMPI